MASVQDEIEVLLSVYPDILTVTDVAAGVEVKLDIPIELEDERLFEIVSSITESNPSSSSSQIESSPSGIPTRLAYLPPVLVTVLLPHEYPTTAGPVLRSLNPRYGWLAPGLVRRLGARLEGIWKEAVEGGARDEGILWAWVEDIRSGAFLEDDRALSSRGKSPPSRGKSPAVPDMAISLPHSAPKTLYQHLLAHQNAAREAQFSAQAFTCGICLAPQRGARCIRLPCEHAHVFCLECLKAFWGLCVSEGEVSRVRCPGVECAQAKGREGDEAGAEEESAAAGSEWEEVVRRVLTEEQVERWKWLRIKQAAEKGGSFRVRYPNTVPCPVRMCQAPVRRPRAAAEDESGWARLRTCDGCGFAFCVACRRTWHGPVTRCAVMRTAEFVEGYIALEEHDPRRRALDAQFGKKVIARMVQEYMQEKENQAWLKERTMECPGCQTHVEKSQGCNHMTCARCNVHFCFRCGTKLRPEQPYKHFEQAGSCYGKLFDYDPAGWEPMEGELLGYALD
ncbi:hypothetical protein BDV93DRAFT_602107 [Ceratobasidium sp. AG-I]|nr:hypothetical protein BDV93DRAFT_602107 [Ceratobasidium sp. AG-I]